MTPRDRVTPRSTEPIGSGHLAARPPGWTWQGSCRGRPGRTSHALVERLLRGGDRRRRASATETLGAGAEGLEAAKERIEARPWPSPGGTPPGSSAAAGRADPMLRRAWRLVVAVIGGTVLALGIARLVLPGPAFVVIPLDLAILATEFVWARRLLKRVREQLRGRRQGGA